MEPSETFPHSFIIRVWLEEITETVSTPKWRGHITHVPSNQRQHFENLDSIKSFIGPFLRTQQVDHE